MNINFDTPNSNADTRKARPGRMVPCRLTSTWALVGLCLVLAPRIQAQITITANDMFNKVGEYYRVHANEGSSPVAVADRIGNKGGPQLWDFTTGPTDAIWRFDYLDPQGTIIGFDFPEATLAERKTEEDNGNQSWLLFEQDPFLGRRVYGFWDLEFNPANPSHIFDPPIVDFPHQIDYGDKWSTSMTYRTDIVFTDDFIIPTLITHTSEFEVDAFGLMDLPNLGFAETLRINELSTIAVAVDFNLEGQFTNVDTQFVRNYYWMQPGRGIAAQMNSQQSANPPSDVFNLAAYFVRMFETNKTTSGGCTAPKAVTDLRLSLNGTNVLLKWTKAECAKSYRVEFAGGDSGTATWQTLGTTTENFILDTNVNENHVRLYRVVSLR